MHLTDLSSLIIQSTLDNVQFSNVWHCTKNLFSVSRLNLYWWWFEQRVSNVFFVWVMILYPKQIRKSLLATVDEARLFSSVTLTRKRRSYILDEKFFFAILQILNIVFEGWYRVHMNEQGIFFRVFPRDNHCWLDDMDRIGLMGLIEIESLTIILYTVPKYNLKLYDTWRNLMI